MCSVWGSHAPTSPSCAGRRRLGRHAVCTRASAGSPARVRPAQPGARPVPVRAVRGPPGRPRDAVAPRSQDDPSGRLPVVGGTAGPGRRGLHPSWPSTTWTPSTQCPMPMTWRSCRPPRAAVCCGPRTGRARSGRLPRRPATWLPLDSAAAPTNGCGSRWTWPATPSRGRVRPGHRGGDPRDGEGRRGRRRGTCRRGCGHVGPSLMWSRAEYTPAERLVRERYAALPAADNDSLRVGLDLVRARGSALLRLERGFRKSARRSRCSSPNRHRTRG